MTYKATFLLVIVALASQQTACQERLRFEAWLGDEVWRGDGSLRERMAYQTQGEAGDVFGYRHSCDTSHSQFFLYGPIKDAWRGTTIIEVDDRPAVRTQANLSHLVVDRSDLTPVRALFRGGKTARVSVTTFEGEYGLTLALAGFTEASDWVDAANCERSGPQRGESQ